MKNPTAQPSASRRPRFQRAGIGWCSAAVLLAAAAPFASAQFGEDHGSGRGTPPAPPTAPSKAPAAPPPPPAPSAAANSQSTNPFGTSSSSYTSIINDNGRTIKLEVKDNVVTLAEVDGKVIPDDRIENDGDVIRLKDEKGEVIYEHELPGGIGASAMVLPPGFPGIDVTDPKWRRFLTVIPPTRSGFARSFSLSEPELSGLATEPAETPSVMIGVQMGEPDSTLCGHLGIERDKVTIVTAVHEGLPAASAGLEPYDLIVSINGQDDADPAAIRAVLKGKKAGETINMGVVHRGVRKDVSLTLESYDRSKLSSAKVHRIEAEDNNLFAVAAGAPAAPMPPLPPSIPEEYRKQIERYMDQYRASAAPRAFTLRGWGGSQNQKEMLEEIARQQEEAARDADRAAQRASELAKRMAERAHQLQGQGGAMNDMTERMRRMEEMLEKLMNEKAAPANPEEPKVKESGNRT